MKKIGMLTIVFLLLSAPFGAAIMTGDNEDGSNTRSFGIDQALVHFNVTYPNGSPAEYVYINIHTYFSNYDYFYRDHDKTNQTGNATIPVSDYNYGLCRITIHDFDLDHFWSIPYFIGPGDEIYMDVVLTEPLPHDRTITGVVRDETGTPLENVVVRLSGSDHQGMPVDMLNTTGTDGIYSFDVPEPMVGYEMQAPYGSFDYYGIYMNIYPWQGSRVYEYDMDMIPVASYDVPVNIRLLNVTTGDPITYSQISISGFNSRKDHGYDYPDVITKTDEDGWLETNLSSGEWWIYWSEWNTIFQNGSITSKMPFLVNSTTSSVIFPISVFDQFRTVYVNLTEKDTGDPIGPGYNVYSRGMVEAHDYPYVDFYQYVGTDSHGLTEFRVPAGIDVTIDFFDWYDYEEKKFIIEAGPAGEDVVLNVSIARHDPPTLPKGDLSILIKDPVSDLPLTDAYIFGWGIHDDVNTSINGNVNEYGYFNRTDVNIGTYEIRIDSRVGTGHVAGMVVSEGAKTESTVEVARNAIPEDDPHLEFRLNDTAGNPLPGISLMFVQRMDLSYYFYYGITDSQGIVHISLSPGYYEAFIPTETSSSGIYRFRNHWNMGTVEFTVEEGEASRTDFTAYEVGDLNPISGFIRDLETGEIIPYQIGYAESNLYVGGTGTRFMGPEPPGVSGRGDDYLQSFYREFHSTTSGYYRVWGRDLIDIRCQREGYFPYLETIDMTTRAPAELDIYLEPLKEYTTFVNGTIRDQDGSPIPGSLEILDLDRDLYLVNGTDSVDGRFNLTLYPGNFLVEYENETLSDSVEITVPEEGLGNLSLYLIPMSMIDAAVRNTEGMLLQGINVTLQKMVSQDMFETIDWSITEEDGSVRFEVPEGSYRLFVGRTEIHDPYTGDILESTGWNDFSIEIILGNRTVADVTGSVYGLAGPMTDGIPNAAITLANSTGHVISSGTTNEAGVYTLLDVPHGTNYTLEAAPPEDLQSNEELYRSGYQSRIISAVNVSGTDVEVDFGLEYVEHTPPGYLNITAYGPVGEDIPLDEFIFVYFSDPVNTTTFEDSFSMAPAPDNITYYWGGNNTVVWVGHDDFAAYTRYIVTVDRSVYSSAGLPLWNSTGMAWNFTTGNESVEWALFFADVVVSDDRSVDVTATGMGFLSVHFVVEGLRSYEMEETSVGIYECHIDGSDLEWDASYTYYFSDQDNGSDLAQHLRGSFQTPEAPEPSDPITSVSIVEDEDGSWIVTVHGEPGQTLYIVIEGVGSFLLNETSPGVYTVTIPGDLFEKGHTYNYYFSNTPGGSNISPDHDGSHTTDDGSSTTTSYALSPLLCCGIVFIILLLLIIVIVIIIIIASRGRGEEDWDEE
ncbi:MAG: Ig-like domain-containing protein [Thermoplasmatota archaeon]